jgi:hypothetical protein
MSLIEMPKLSDYSGRMLLLNLERVQRFQCPGFTLSKNNYYQIVPCYTETNPSLHEAMNRALNIAILDGRLIDITGQDVKGLKMAGGEHTPVQEEDTGSRVFMATDKHGNLFVVAPKDKEEEAKYIEEIKTTGTLKLDYEHALNVEKIEEVIQPAPKIIITDVT